MQIGKSRTTKELWRLGIPSIKIQKASKDLQMGGILFPKIWGKLFEDEDLKTMENQRLDQGNKWYAPRACKLLYSHAPRAFVMSPRACKNVGRNCLFMLPCWAKPTVLAQIQVETLTIITSLPHSEFQV